MSERSCEAVGIDLGTTFSALAYMDQQQIPRIVPDRQGKPVTSSVVYFDDDGMPIVGDVALDKAVVASDRAVQFVKVHMGDEWSFTVGKQVHTPESISAIILAHLVRESEPQIGPMKKAVITVPAFFTEKRRRATQQAGEIAGLEVIGTLHEPVAAALAYGLHRSVDVKEQNVLIYDLGGGTFDVTVVRISTRKLEELSICGNRQLGGKDWDKCVIDLAVREFAEQFRIDLAAAGKTGDPEALQALQDLQITSEKVKRHLSSLARTEIKLQAYGHSYRREVTRQEFEALTAHLVNLTKLTTNQAVKDAGFVTKEGRADWSKIDRAVLVGGSTQMPMVRSMLQQIGGKPPDIGINPSTAVALGAAVYAQILESGQGPQQIVEHQTPSAPVRFVTAHGVGLRVRQHGVRVNDVLLHKNTAVPAQVVRQYRTVKKEHQDQANRISIVVTQGDTPDPDAVEVLGTASFTGIPRDEPAGQPVEVTLAFDANGRLHLLAVYTKSDHTRQQLALELEVPGGLCQKEVEEFRQLFEQSGLISKTA